jgi:uncharacterized protein
MFWFLKRLRAIKPEIRVLGVDDGKFAFRSKTAVPVVGVVFRGGYWFEGFMSSQITVDGFDATKNIGNMVVGSSHFKQLRVILLNGLTFGGLNIVDIKALSELTGLPVIAVSERKPDLEKIRLALEKLPCFEERWKAVLNAGDIFPSLTRGKKQVFAEVAGLSKDLSLEILKLTSTRSKLPEPLRVAHLIASGISLYSS